MGNLKEAGPGVVTRRKSTGILFIDSIIQMIRNTAPAGRKDTHTRAEMHRRLSREEEAKARAKVYVLKPRSHAAE